jgi:hypothetical protein
LFTTTMGIFKLIRLEDLDHLNPQTMVKAGFQLKGI